MKRKQHQMGRVRIILRYLRTISKPKLASPWCLLFVVGFCSILNTYQTHVNHILFEAEVTTTSFHIDTVLNRKDDKNSQHDTERNETKYSDPNLIPNIVPMNGGLDLESHNKYSKNDHNDKERKVTQLHPDPYLIPLDVVTNGYTNHDDTNTDTNKEVNETAHSIPTSISGVATHDRLYLRYDEAGIRPILGTARSHHLPNAVPEFRTIPRHLAEDKAYHQSQRRNTSSKAEKNYEYNLSHDYTKDYRTLYLYNPHVLPLHNTIENSKLDPDFLSESDLHALTGGDPTVRYLVTYRAFLSCNCFGILPGREIMKNGEKVSYLAVALLDEHLDVIDGTDVLIDINRSPPFGGPNKYYVQNREDCRTFLIQSDIQILCNGFIHKVRIRRNMDPKPSTNTTTNSHQVPYIYENIYGNGLEITLLHNSTRLWYGKNLNIFRVPSLLRQAENTAGRFQTEKNYHDYYLQTFPIPHLYERLTSIGEAKSNIKVDRNITKTPLAPVPSPSFDSPDTNATRLQCRREYKLLRRDADQSKCTTKFDEVPFFPDNEHVDHGTACCVPMALGKNQSVMVGISHVKLSPMNPYWKRDRDGRYNTFMHDQFISRFVAYDTKPPFNIVAKSGGFCLGAAEEDEGRAEIGGNSLAGRNTRYRLELFDTYDCPPIHFISAFSEVVGDKSKAIIGYGINDCYPRMMMVEKQDIVNRLLGKI